MILLGARTDLNGSVCMFNKNCRDSIAIKIRCLFLLNIKLVCLNLITRCHSDRRSNRAYNQSRNLFFLFFFFFFFFFFTLTVGSILD